MSKYQTFNLGTYIQMLVDDAVHATFCEVRVDDEDGEHWEKDPNIIPADEVRDACCEIAHHLFDMVISLNTIAELTDYSNALPEDMQKYIATRFQQQEKIKESWEWIYDYLGIEDDFLFEDNSDE